MISRVCETTTHDTIEPYTRAECVLVEKATQSVCAQFSHTQDGTRHELIMFLQAKEDTALTQRGGFLVLQLKENGSGVT